MCDACRESKWLEQLNIFDNNHFGKLVFFIPPSFRNKQKGVDNTLRMRFISFITTVLSHLESVNNIEIYPIFAAQKLGFFPKDHPPLGRSHPPLFHP